MAKMPAPSETLRPLADALFDAREWAAENGLDGALADARHRHVVEAALDGRIPAQRINARWYYRPEDRALIATTLARRFLRAARPPASVAAA